MAVTLWVDWLADAARTTGYPVVEVDGWGRRGHGPMVLCEGVVGHHTGTEEDSIRGDYPSLRVVKEGRAGLLGPLSHLGLGRSGTIYVIAAGKCYHAGDSAHAGFTQLNDKYLGIEAEDEGDGDWTDEQLDAYPKLVAAMLKRMGRGVGRYVSHRECATHPRGRKPDPAGISDEWMHAKITQLWSKLPVPPPAGAGSLPRLREGDRNDDVMALHEWMTRKYRWAAAMFSPTGFYGPFTVKAVKEFQRRVGIIGPDADGTIIGPKTNAALWAEGYRGAA